MGPLLVYHARNAGAPSRYISCANDGPLLLSSSLHAGIGLLPLDGDAGTSGGRSAARQASACTVQSTSSCI